MTFEEYLTSKKTDPGKFREAEPERYQELQTLFDQVHPNSFAQQKLFLINRIRRKYLLPVTSKETTEERTPQKKVKPRIVPKKPS